MALTDSLVLTASALVSKAQVIAAGGGWDLKSFLENSTDYLKLVGGLLIALIGLAGVIWAAVKIIGKLMGAQSAQQTSWGLVITLFIVGGAMMVGGGALVFDIAAGGQQTVRDMGGGTILPFLGTYLP